MKKLGFIALAIAASSLLFSCAGSKAAGHGYHGVTNVKANKKKQKEFQKPKHKIKKSKPIKRGNWFVFHYNLKDCLLGGLFYYGLLRTTVINLTLINQRITFHSEE